MIMRYVNRTKKTRLMAGTLKASQVKTSLCLSMESAFLDYVKTEGKQKDCVNDRFSNRKKRK